MRLFLLVGSGPGDSTDTPVFVAGLFTGQPVSCMAQSLGAGVVAPRPITMPVMISAPPATVPHDTGSVEKEDAVCLRCPTRLDETDARTKGNSEFFP